MSDCYMFYLLQSLLSKRELILAAQVACILLIGVGVGFATGCGSYEVMMRGDRW